MNQSDRILIIDDEVQIRRLLEITLTANGYKIAEASTAHEGINLAASINPMLIILDLGLPDMDGQDVLLRIRQWFTGPVIILSVRNTEEDIVKALDNGASDYLTKPFRTRELMARIRAACRKTAPDSESVLEFGALRIDLSKHLVYLRDEILKLTSTEFSLLALLARNEDRVLTHSFILKEVWGLNYVNQPQYLRVYIAQLRKKIEEDPSKPVYLITESGIGYRFRSE